ncbi:MAG: hypothetical protein JXR13_16185 [Thalassovita sp.]
MSSEFMGTLLGILICIAVAGIILVALFSGGSKKTKRSQSRSTFVAGIDDAPVSGDPSSE